MASETGEKIRVVVLFSGGLDSSLAVRLMQNQGLDVTALTCINAFSPELKQRRGSGARRMARQLGVPLIMHEFTDQLIKLVENPPHGYGSNMNPCVDCHCHMLKYVAGLIAEGKYHFVATGEVLGQRPMSQRKPVMMHIDKEAGLGRMVLRPLSAKCMPITIPEEKGWVDREKLKDFNGRSRKPQMQLAKEFGFREYQTPAGGCLLTDPQFAFRVKDLKEHEGLTEADVEIMKVGRYFRLSDSARIIVGRNQADNQALQVMSLPGDVRLRAASAPGPTAVLRVPADEDSQTTIAAMMTAQPCPELLTLAAELVAAHCPKLESDPTAGIRLQRGDAVRTVDVKVRQRSDFAAMRIELADKPDQKKGGRAE
ncbi:MAG TPA: hypothetical protein PL033_15100 [Candidatus Brocadiia bacterium]|nr:hypothetical protein [Candidatus Brocadiia bacterium]